MNNSRALTIIVFVILFCAALIVKLFDIQIIKSEELKYYAERQQMDLEKIKAERGLIHDRNGVLLVYNRNDISFYLDLRMVSKAGRKKIAEKFSTIFDKSENHYLGLMSEKKGKTICIEKKASSEKALLLKNFKVAGLFYRDDPTRVYHYDNLASHIIGYVGNEYDGVNGIEKSFEEILRGNDGTMLVERDAIGDMITVSEEETRPAIAGESIYLTINKTYQSILEEELLKGLNEYGGSSAIGVIMDPNSGEILAMANKKDFNPNSYWKYSNEERRNISLTDTYEPGSTFKTISLAALIDQNLVRLNERVNTENGRYKFKSVHISDTHESQSLTVREVIEQSSNVGVSKLIQRIDDDSFYKYLRGFGFGNYTSIPLPGEAKGTLKKPNQWNPITKTFMSFGYELSVTPIQLTAAYSAIVNGGILYQPTIVKRITGRDGIEIKENSSKEVRRVISEETSTTMRDILVGVVKNGTGKNARIENVSIGGKTGTSQKLINGKYSKSHYNSSFAGFFPAEDPKVVCLILVNSPDVGRYGGLVAAPIFKNVAERLANTNPEIFKTNYERIESNLYADKDSDINGTKIIPAGNFKAKEMEKDQTFSRKFMPDLSDYSLRDAITILTKIGVKYKIEGSGIVISQSIQPGKNITKGMTCIINCSNNQVGGAAIY